MFKRLYSCTVALWAMARIGHETSFKVTPLSSLCFREKGGSWEAVQVFLWLQLLSILGAMEGEKYWALCSARTQGEWLGLQTPDIIQMLPCVAKSYYASALLPLTSRLNWRWPEDLFSNFIQIHTSEIWLVTHQVSNHSPVETYTASTTEVMLEVSWSSGCELYKPTSFIPGKRNLEKPF